MTSTRPEALSSRAPGRAARAAAVVTWAYAAGFGLAAPPVAVYLIREGHLPSLLGLFDSYAGPWSESVGTRTFVTLLSAFLGVNALTAWSGWLIWRGRRSGAVLNLALIPVEAIFWVGFALPIPWLCGAARVALLTAAWRSMGAGAPTRTQVEERNVA